MSDTNDGGQAFPQSSTQSGPFGGLTRRDYFAAAAMTGLLACNATYRGATNDRMMLARDARAHADALIAVLKDSE